MSELKPCPFCGSKAEAYETVKGFTVMCSNGDCVELQMSDWTSDRAISLWNTRADGWINVDDELPMMHQQVLVWSEFADGTPTAFIEFYNGSKRGFRGINNYHDKYVTHWMPLPKPPGS